MVCNPHKKKLETTSLELDTINYIIIQPIHPMMGIRMGPSKPLRLLSPGKGNAYFWSSKPGGANPVLHLRLASAWKPR